MKRIYSPGGFSGISENLQPRLKSGSEGDLEAWFELGPFPTPEIIQIGSLCIVPLRTFHAPGMSRYPLYLTDEATGGRVFLYIGCLTGSGPLGVEKGRAVAPR